MRKCCVGFYGFIQHVAKALVLMVCHTINIAILFISQSWEALIVCH